MLVIDDFIPKSLQEKYKSWLLEDEFPWYYIPDVTNMDNVQKRPALSHKIYENGVKTSMLDVEYLGHLGAEKYKWDFNGILHAKTILQFPLNLNFAGIDLDFLHTDINPHIPHLVVLYYVLDSDGDTIICDLKNTGFGRNDLHAKDYKVLQKVKPKQGRAVIFDGTYYHTAEQPRDNVRCIINMNIV
jgi:hypothetical protein